METKQLSPYQKPLINPIKLYSEQGFALSGYENDDDGWSQPTGTGNPSNWD